MFPTCGSHESQSLKVLGKLPNSGKKYNVSGISVQLIQNHGSRKFTSNMLKPGGLDLGSPGFRTSCCLMCQVPNFGTAGEEGRKHGKGNGSVGEAPGPTLHHLSILRLNVGPTCPPYSTDRIPSLPLKPSIATCWSLT